MDQEPEPLARIADGLLRDVHADGFPPTGPRCLKQEAVGAANVEQASPPSAEERVGDSKEGVCVSDVPEAISGVVAVSYNRVLAALKIRGAVECLEIAQVLAAVYVNEAAGVTADD
jgi:hypothetical protein